MYPCRKSNKVYGNHNLEFTLWRCDIGTCRVCLVCLHRFGQSWLPDPADSSRSSYRAYSYCFNAHMNLGRAGELLYWPNIICLLSMPMMSGWTRGKVVESSLSYLEGILLLKSSSGNLGLLPSFSLGVCVLVVGFFPPLLLLSFCKQNLFSPVFSDP